MSKAIWILSDQCDPNNTALKGLEPDDWILMAESYADLDLRFAHQKRTAFILAVYRQFAHDLSQRHPQLRYLRYTRNASETQIERLSTMTRELKLTQVILMKPKDYHQREALQTLDFSLELCPDSNLISDEETYLPWFRKSSFRMERFYQKMRQPTGILMDQGEPVGGRYNFDQDNQQRLREFPAQLKRRSFRKSPLLLETLLDVRNDFPHHLGDLESFYFAITPKQAQIELEDFIAHHLKDFGRYQDNIILGDAFVRHSLLSAYINVGLLNPLEVCVMAENAYRNHIAPIESAEGFIRQILGWREYMFYRYLVQMPALESTNHYQAHRPLPAFFWTGRTQMRCLSNFVSDSLDHAYAHHIQRLMIGANFALLAELDPQAVSAWYQGIYADAWPWVELPNVMGMGLYADGGKIGSKPYIASAAYIHRMSNACQACHYHHDELSGENACPFNALYWHHIAKNLQDYLKNPRMSMIANVYVKFADEKKQAIQKQAEWNFSRQETSL